MDGQGPVRVGLGGRERGREGGVKSVFEFCSSLHLAAVGKRVFKQGGEVDGQRPVRVGLTMRNECLVGTTTT